MEKRLVYGSSSSIRKKGKGTSKEKLYKTTEERSSSRRVVLIGYKLTDELESKKCEDESFFWQKHVAQRRLLPSIYGSKKGLNRGGINSMELSNKAIKGEIQMMQKSVENLQQWVQGKEVRR